MDAKTLAASIPPISKLGLGKGKPVSEPGMDMGDEGADDDKAAGVGMMGDLRAALASDDDEAAYEAFCQLVDSHRGV